MLSSIKQFDQQICRCRKLQWKQLLQRLMQTIHFARYANKHHQLIYPTAEISLCTIRVLTATTDKNVSIYQITLYISRVDNELPFKKSFWKWICTIKLILKNISLSKLNVCLVFCTFVLYETCCTNNK